MRQFAILILLSPFALFAQENCDLFTLQALAAQNLMLQDSIAQFQVDTVILHPGGAVEVQLSNGQSYTQIRGCTDPDYAEYDESATIDDGSCVMLTASCQDVAMGGYTYSVVLLDDQCWFAENLRTTVYQNGSGIYECSDHHQWVEGQSPGDGLAMRCNFNNDNSTVASIGRLYNWFTVNSPKGLCPVGWHVPTNSEWMKLSDYFSSQGGYSGLGSDDFGFSIVPGGTRGGFFIPCIFWDASFDPEIQWVNWWSSSSAGPMSWRMSFSLDGSMSGGLNQTFSQQGLAVRCLKDAG